MASKQRADKQKEKEKREKIILVALVAVLVIVGAIELPSMLGGKKASSPSSSVAQTTTPTTSSVANPGGTSTSGESASIGGLPDASRYQAHAGQLSGFSLFNNGNPFGSATSSSSESTTASSTTASSTTTTSGKTKSTTISTSNTQYAAARISVNGTSEDVTLNATFPSTSPVFVLNSIMAKKIEISVAGGSFSSGQSTVTIKKGRSVVLVNTVDSMRYAIKFAIALTASQASSSTGTTTSGTTTSGTTTSGTTSSTT